MGKAVVSMSLWGADPMYLYGAIENALRLPKVYPGWELRIYASESASKGVLSVLRALGASVVVMGADTACIGLYWRMLPAFEPGVDCMVVRDADSRIGPREAACVKEWRESGKPLHCMRDHKLHTAPIMGGTWGCIPAKLIGLLPDVKKRHAEYTKRITDGTVTGGRYGRHVNSDQVFLYEYIWEQVDRSEIMIHDDLKHFGGELPFPTPNPSPMDFVGQVYDVPNRPRFQP